MLPQCTRVLANVASTISMDDSWFFICCITYTLKTEWLAILVIVVYYIKLFDSLTVLSDKILSRCTIVYYELLTSICYLITITCLPVATYFVALVYRIFN